MAQQLKERAHITNRTLTDGASPHYKHPLKAGGKQTQQIHADAFPASFWAEDESGQKRGAHQGQMSTELEQLVPARGCTNFIGDCSNDVHVHSVKICTANDNLRTTMYKELFISPIPSCVYGIWCYKPLLYRPIKERRLICMEVNMHGSLLPRTFPGTRLKVSRPSSQFNI